MSASHNVVVRLLVSRPENEYLPELLKRRLGWDSYAGHMRVVGVEVLSDHSPFPEGGAVEAISTLDSVDTPPSACVT